MESTTIKSSCRIESGQIYRNEDLFFEQTESEFPVFIKAAFKQLELKYGKFWKMDRLSKLAFLAAEIVLKDIDLEDYKPTEIGVVMANRYSTLQTDSKHTDSIKDRAAYFPSPSVFVYTLPNIMVGEICIRHKFQGENAFFVSEKYDEPFLLNYAQSLLDTGILKACLVGWADYTEQNYQAILHLIKLN